VNRVAVGAASAAGLCAAAAAGAGAGAAAVCTVGIRHVDSWFHGDGLVSPASSPHVVGHDVAGVGAVLEPGLVPAVGSHRLSGPPTPPAATAAAPAAPASPPASGCCGARCAPSGRLCTSSPRLRPPTPLPCASAGQHFRAGLLGARRPVARKRRKAVNRVAVGAASAAGLCAAAAAGAGAGPAAVCTVGIRHVEA
jgi:hypothetical protein